jgi:ABC-type transporter Mla MlaB component
MNAAKGDLRLAAPKDPLTPPKQPSTTRSDSRRDTIVLVIGGRIAPADVPVLCGRARATLEHCAASTVVCDVAALVDPDAVTVDALARLQLSARRSGSRVLLRHPSAELQELLALMGLAEVLPCSAGLCRGRRGEAEEREQGGGVEKEGDPGDPPA